MLIFRFLENISVLEGGRKGGAREGRQYIPLELIPDISSKSALRIVIVHGFYLSK